MEHELIQVRDTVRVEFGPVRKTAVATEELLSNSKTAGHYYAGMGVDPMTKQLKQGIDAFAKPIVLGEEMTYIDYKGVGAFHVYELRDTFLEKITGRPTDNKANAQIDANGKVIVEQRYIEADVIVDREEAIAAAEKLGGAA